MKKTLSLILSLVIFVSLTVSVEAFSLSNLSSTTAGFGGISNLICQFIHILCPSGGQTSGGTITPGGGVSMPGSPSNGGQSGGGFSLPAGLPGIGTSITSGFPGLSLDIVKQLWGDKPPLSWGGITGGGGIPIPFGKSGGTNNTTGGGGSGGTGGSSSLPACAPGQPIKECSGGASACQSYCTPEANRAGCLTRGCYCTENSSANDPDCSGFRELMKNPLAKQFIGSCKCGGGTTGSSRNSGGSNQSGVVAGTPIAGCQNTDIDTCKKACLADYSRCQQRIKDCRNGRASGDDCQTFQSGYDFCCTSLENRKSCENPNNKPTPDANDVKLIAAFCGSSIGSAPLATASNTPSGLEGNAQLGEFQQYCQSETTDNCKNFFDTCNLPENRRNTVPCVKLDALCREEIDRLFCRDHGYFAEK